MVVQIISADTRPHKYTTTARRSLKTVCKPTNYGLFFEDYEDFIKFLPRVKGDPELVSQIIALLQSEWRPAVPLALEEFYERIRCSKCNPVTGTSGTHCRLSPDSQKSFEALVHGMEQVPVESLSERKIKHFTTSLGKLEKEYLNANLGKVCKGLD
jgi:hypothetical protein